MILNCKLQNVQELLYTKLYTATFSNLIRKKISVSSTVTAGWQIVHNQINKCRKMFILGVYIVKNKKHNE